MVTSVLTNPKEAIQEQVRIQAFLLFWQRQALLDFSFTSSSLFRQPKYFPKILGKITLIFQLAHLFLLIHSFSRKLCSLFGFWRVCHKLKTGDFYFLKLTFTFIIFELPASSKALISISLSPS